MLHPFLKHAFLTCLASVLLLACKDSAPDNLSPEEGTYRIDFGSQLSKALVTDINSMSDFKVWGWAHKNAAYSQLFNSVTVFTKTGQYEGPVQFWMDGYTHDFFAVHPYTLAETNKINSTNKGKLTVNNFNAKAVGNDAIDLMTAYNKDMVYSAGNNPQPGPVTLQFAHELAKVEFTVKALQSADVSAKLYGISHKGNMTKAFEGTPSVWTSAWELAAANTVGKTPFTKPTFNVPLFVEGTSIPLPLFNGLMLLPPQPLKETTTSIKGATLQLIYTYNSDNHKVTKDINLYNIKNITQWEAGKSYHYEITIPKRSFDINITVKVTDWNNKDISTIL